MNNETLRKAQQNTRMNELRSIQGMQDMAFPRVQFSKNFPGEHAPGPPYISNSSIRGWQSACFSNNLVFSIQLQKNSMPRQNGWLYQVWMKQKFEHQRIQNETKLPLRKSLSQ